MVGNELMTDQGVRLATRFKRKVVERLVKSSSETQPGAGSGPGGSSYTLIPPLNAAIPMISGAMTRTPSTPRNADVKVPGTTDPTSIDATVPDTVLPASNSNVSVLWGEALAALREKDPKSKHVSEKFDF